MLYEPNLAAIILAAGFSSRMFDFKPLLPLGKKSVIEHAIGNFQQAGIADICVVLGYRSEDLRPVLERSGVRWVNNNNYAQGMYSSVITGVRSLSEQTEACFLLPADMPLISSQTINSVAAAYSTKAAVVYPSLRGRRGHPPLISASLFPALLAWSGEGGLRRFLAQYESKMCEVQVQDEAIFLDADTRADYEYILTVFNSRV
jgi:CTP:molybdopterin cytidylyltransferase MocA